MIFIFGAVVLPESECGLKSCAEWQEKPKSELQSAKQYQTQNLKGGEAHNGLLETFIHLREFCASMVEGCTFSSEIHSYYIPLLTPFTSLVTPPCYDHINWSLMVLANPTFKVKRSRVQYT